MIHQKRVVLARPSGMPAGVTLRAGDGGENYYANNSFTYAVTAGWDNPDFFPIGVWYGSITAQADADRWLDLGLNMSFRTTSPSSNALMRTNGIWAFEEPGETSGMGAESVGLLTGDEPTTYADAVGPISTTANVTQDHRYWFINNTWNMINFGDIGGVPAATVFSDLIATPNATTRHLDIQSADIYWCAGARTTSALTYQGGQIYGLGRDMTAAEAARGCRAGDMVDQIRVYQTTYPAPLAQFVENGGPYIENTTFSTYITPPELNISVWSAIIHGAKQICYFNHSFAGPGSSNDNLAQSYFQTIQSPNTISIYNQTKATNALVRKLAKVINARTASGYVTVNPPPVIITSSVADSGFDIMAKWYGGKFYIFAAPRYAQTTTNQTATFTIKNTGGTVATVINEARGRPITNNGTRFTDTFADGNTVHIYRID